jgi:hypothetical protein
MWRQFTVRKNHVMLPFGKLRLTARAAFGLDLDDHGGFQQGLTMPEVPGLGARFALGASAGWPLLIGRIGRGGTIRVTGALLQVGFERCDPRPQRVDPCFQVLDDLQQLQDQVAHDEGDLCPTGGLSQRPCW